MLTARVPVEAHHRCACEVRSLTIYICGCAVYANHIHSYTPCLLLPFDHIPCARSAEHTHSAPGFRNTNHRTLQTKYKTARVANQIRLVAHSLRGIFAGFPCVRVCISREYNLCERVLKFIVYLNAGRNNGRQDILSYCLRACFIQNARGAQILLQLRVYRCVCWQGAIGLVYRRRRLSAHHFRQKVSKTMYQFRLAQTQFMVLFVVRHGRIHTQSLKSLARVVLCGNN